MSLWHSIILGIVEGITEFLPISSTGHLILTNALLGITESGFVKSFSIIIQLGAILAVVVLYWNKIWNVERWKKIIVAFIPTAIIGFALYKVVKTYLIGNTAVVLWALLLGGVALILFEMWHRRKSPVGAHTEPTYKQAFIIGLFQSLAIIPGVSRSAVSIVGGLSQGLSRVAITEFSFLLAIPTILAASGYDIVKNYSIFTTDNFGGLLVGFVVSFIVAILSIKFLLRYVEKHTFIAFGVYRIVVALLFLLFFF